MTTRRGNSLVAVAGIVALTAMVITGHGDVAVVLGGFALFVLLVLS